MYHTNPNTIHRHFHAHRSNSRDSIAYSLLPHIHQDRSHKIHCIAPMSEAFPPYMRGNFLMCSLSRCTKMVPSFLHARSTPIHLRSATDNHSLQNCNRMVPLCSSLSLLVCQTPHPCNNNVYIRSALITDSRTTQTHTTCFVALDAPSSDYMTYSSDHLATLAALPLNPPTSDV